jgi:hypothetical protein
MVLGVDLSTKAIDLVALDEDNPARCEHRRVTLNSPWWDAAISMHSRLLAERVYPWIRDRDIYLAGVERPYGPHRQAIASLHTVLGAVLCCFNRLSITAFEVSPADMRRELGLPGNCAKERMHHEVLSTGAFQGQGFLPLDALDAWAAGHAALRINERGTPMEEAA